MTNKQSLEWQIFLSKLKTSILRTYGDVLVDYFLYSQLPARYCGNLRMIREPIIKKQHMGGRQTKISDVFTPCSYTNSAGPSNNDPRVSCSPATPELEYEDSHQKMVCQ